MEAEVSGSGRSAVTVGVLGSLEVWSGAERVSAGHARQRSVLAVLAVEANRVVPVDSLLDRVWGEQPPSRARSALRTYLSHLRRALLATGATIARQGNGYLLTVEPDAVDAHRFRGLLAEARAQRDPRLALELAEAGLALWRGEPLAELDTPWALQVREHLRQERIAAEADRIDWALACGRHRQVLPELTARAEADPLDERMAGQLMLALYGAGRQADALAHYQRTRQRLAEELGTDPGRPLDLLHRRILNADITLAPAEITTAGPPTVPRQLPAPPRWFTGRAAHLAGLDAAADRQGTVVISAIGGTGGIGKTWLALAWAHRHLERFPDGQLFVDLHGFGPQGAPLDPEVALRRFLESLGVAADRVPADQETQAALFRSLVASKRILVVLDNAATAEQVVPLLPGGTTCTVLVTSRNRLHGLIARHGACPLPLDVLTAAESRDLLVAALGPARVADDDRAAAELISLCGGLPLALGLIVARVQPDLPLTEAVTELRESGLDALDTDDPTASLPAVLSWSLRRLTEQQRTVFALLGIAPGPDIGLPAASSLADLTERETRAVLRALADTALIDSRPGGRYAMHDLVRAYAATLAHDSPAPVREAALERVVDFYLHTAHAADHVVEPHGMVTLGEPPAPGVTPLPLPDQSTAMAWLDNEHPHLLAAQHTAASLHLHHAVWHLAWNLTAFHWRRGHLHDDLAVWTTALTAASHLPDPAVRIRTHRQLGSAYTRLGQHEEAAGQLHQALALAERHQDTTQQALTHYALASTWGRRGDNRKALSHARHALDLHHAVDDPVWKAVSLNQVGWYAALSGEHNAAREHCQAALALNRHHHNPTGEAGSLDSLGYIDQLTGRHDQAIHGFSQALALFRALGHTYETADTLDNIGRSQTALGQHDQAREAWQEARELYQEQNRHADAERMRRQLHALDHPDV